MDYIGHSRNEAGERQPLVEHLQNVAKMAADFAAPFGGEELARCLGYWHDVGKFHPEFQEYLRDAEANPGKHRRGPDHKAAGVQIAMDQKLEPLAIALQGHHGGMKDRTDFQVWFQPLAERTDIAIEQAQSTVPGLTPFRPILPPIAFAQNTYSIEMFVRFLFSALVDADFLDTEAHFSPERASKRDAGFELEALWQRFQAAHHILTSDTPDSTVNRVRRAIYDACLRSASLPPGFFRLTVPTGGGKTLSGMAFGLRHALAHDLRRVVVAVPFLSITQQTAAVYHSLFSDPSDQHPVVVEHHSGILDANQDDSEYNPQHIWRRLAAENWDAPIIVTTTVQLLESLFASGTSRCRKLHRLAKSVIILDEAQSLPIPLLEPILDVLQELCANYGATVVLSTATQPVYNVIPTFERLRPYEIVPTPERHFNALRRVRYNWQHKVRWSWEDVAARMQDAKQALCIVNLKRHALELLETLQVDGVFHLSTSLCGAHRNEVLAEVRRRLANESPCRLVSTQVVEAGVDLDFPLVLRALGPMDSIIQAGGRANREGKLEQGEVIIFRPEDEQYPGKGYKRAAQIGEEVVDSGLSDLNDPAVVEEYFRRLFALEEGRMDDKEIQNLRARFCFETVSKKFRLIEEDTVSTIVKYGGADSVRRIERWIEALEHREGNPRQLFRHLQPFTVSIRRYQAEKYTREGYYQPIGDYDDIGVWLGQYDGTMGLLPVDPHSSTYIF